MRSDLSDHGVKRPLYALPAIKTGTSDRHATGRREPTTLTEVIHALDESWREAQKTTTTTRKQLMRWRSIHPINNQFKFKWIKCSGQKA